MQMETTLRSGLRRRISKSVNKPLDILDKLEHRGAVSADGKTGDGAGILIEIPHDFLVHFIAAFKKKYGTTPKKYLGSVSS